MHGSPTKLAGFGTDGAKNFPGIVTDLQMQLYLVVADFKRRQNKRGGEYGMPVSILLLPEAVWGYDAVTAAYVEPPEESARRIAARSRNTSGRARRTPLCCATAATANGTVVMDDAWNPLPEKWKTVIRRPIRKMG